MRTLASESDTAYVVIAFSTPQFLGSFFYALVIFWGYAHTEYVNHKLMIATIDGGMYLGGSDSWRRQRIFWLEFIVFSR